MNANLMSPFLSIYASVSVKHLRRIDVKTFGAHFFIAVLPVTPNVFTEDCC